MKLKFISLYENFEEDDGLYSLSVENTNIQLDIYLINKKIISSGYCDLLECNHNIQRYCNPIKELSF